MGRPVRFDFKAFEDRLFDETARLSDPHPWVRRLVVLAISYWKAAAEPYRGAIEALRDDPDETVRRIVEHVLGKG